MNSSSLPLHVTLPMAVLGLVHHTEKQWKFILARKQGFLLKLLLGKEMDQGAYIEFCYLSEHKFLSKRRSVSVQTLQPRDGKGLISSILYFLGDTKGIIIQERPGECYVPSKPREQLTVITMIINATCPETKASPRYWSQCARHGHNFCGAETIVFWQQRMDLEGPNKNPEFSIHHPHLPQQTPCTLPQCLQGSERSPLSVSTLK